VIVNLQEKLKEKLKKTLPPYAFSAANSGISPAARRMVKEALALAKAGNLSGAVDTAFTAGYVAACANLAKELERALAAGTEEG